MSAPNPLPPPEWRTSMPPAQPPPGPQQVFGPPQVITPDQPDLSRVPVPFTAPAGSRLEQLAAEYDRLQDLVAKPNKELDEIKDQIKAEISRALPEGRHVGIVNASGLSTPIRVSATVSRRLQGKALQRDYPQVWLDYSTESTSWKVERAKGGE